MPQSQTAQAPSACLVLLGDQLFAPSLIAKLCPSRKVFMAESWDLCTHFAYHKQKILLFLASMRHYRDELRKAGFTVDYHSLDVKGERQSFTQIFADYARRDRTQKVYHFEISDRFFELAFLETLKVEQLTREELANPSFLTPRPVFQDYLRRHPQPKMQSFYQEQRLRLKILLDGNKPVGGKWSFDTENRKKLPASIFPPPLPRTTQSEHVQELTSFIQEHFPKHPGSLDTFIWPVTRTGAQAWLKTFVKDRLELFGPYEDAITARSDLVFHSGLSPLLNLGLITPREVLEAVLAAAQKQDVPLESLEGFVRQLIGWREFIFGIAQNFHEREHTSNFFGHKRRLGKSWYEGSTGLVPIDQAIDKAKRLGYVHHIERLMLLSNLMLLCEIEPTEVYRWFMEMFVDSADWVMAPNVFGMGQFSDGGLFATKPYISGSNYILKMSDASKGPWCEIIDGLYWRFVDRHRDFFASQPRMSMMVHLLEKIPAERYQRIRGLADAFLEQHTHS